ncbi:MULTISPECIES: helix-turn-helix transcriptional regulator [Aeromonas]|uniref:helix-turn-helix transcriptional regulator n=1 Tax=Aeromonas TaxID=642 RepID=UPI0005A6F2D3|nr:MULTISPECIES: AlpA family transcriptional regulator [Aeromonas]QXC29904.1 AlpA family transcriptional regulator [Aeromonas sp. FDAARGOS 1409]
MSTHSHTPERRIMRLPQVKTATGFGRAWIYELMKRGEFPQARKIGTRAIGWDSEEIQQWVSQRLDGGAN